MKKIIGLLAALLLSTTAAFAKGYKGDVQIMAGFGLDSVYTKISTTERKLGDFTFQGNIESWHLFGINDTFSLGVMISLDESIGAVTHFDVYNNGTKVNSYDQSDLGFAYKIEFFIGPAFTFTFGDTLRLGISPGLSVLIANGISYEGTSDTYIAEFSGIGPGLTIQTKFIPNKRVSPIISYRFAVNFADKFKNGQYKNGGIFEPATVTQDKIIVFTNVLTAGISINW